MVLPGGCRLCIRGTGGPAEGETCGVVFLDQVHGGRIVLEPAGGEAADGMIVRRGSGFPGLRLADCASLFLVSEGWLGAAHAGWRGLAAGVVSRLVSCFPEPPLAAVSAPCICSRCYRVGDEVRDLFAGRGSSIHPEGALDLQAELAAQAAGAGLAVEVISSGSCTACGPGEFHSWRRDASAGRNLAWLRG